MDHIRKGAATSIPLSTRLSAAAFFGAILGLIVAPLFLVLDTAVDERRLLLAVALVAGAGITAVLVYVFDYLGHRHG